MKFFNNLTAVLLLILFAVTPSCDLAEPEIGIPNPNQEREVFFDNATRVVQDQNTMTRFFSAVTQSLILNSAAQQTGVSVVPPCATTVITPGTSGNPPVTTIAFGDDGTQVGNPGCNIGTDLRVFGTLNFTIIDVDSNNQPTVVQLSFLSFRVNGCDVTLENFSNPAAEKNIRFTKVSGTQTAYFLFNITLPLGESVRITNNNNGINSVTDFFPFGFDFIEGEPTPVFAKLRINNNANSDLQDFEDLQDKDYVFKLERNNDPNYIPGAPDAAIKFWRARYNNNGTEENYTLITGGAINTTDPEDIPGLSFNLGCGHFNDGILILRRQTPGGLCYYKYRDYDFGYEMQTGDVGGTSVVCGNPAPSDPPACDGWVQVTAYTGNSGMSPCNLAANIMNQNCGAINQNCAGVCTIEECF